MHTHTNTSHYTKCLLTKTMTSPINKPTIDTHQQMVLFEHAKPSFLYLHDFKNI